MQLWEIILGVLVVGFFVGYLIYILYISKKGAETEATLIRIGTRGYGTVSYTVDGTNYETGVDAFGKQKVGNTVRICYLSSNPKRIVVKGGALKFKIVGVIILIAAIVFAIVKEGVLGV
jgi:hypothetical protein